MERNKELTYWFNLYKNEFGESVPLSEIGNRENSELIDAVKKSIEAKKDLLPEIFGLVYVPQKNSSGFNEHIEEELVGPFASKEEFWESIGI